MNIENSIAYFKQTFYDSTELDNEVKEGEAPFCLNYSDEISVFFCL